MLPSMEKIKSLAVCISSALWSSYSRWSCLLNSWMSRLSSSIFIPDLKSSSWQHHSLWLLFKPPGVAVGLFPRLVTDPVRLLGVGTAIFRPEEPSGMRRFSWFPLLFLIHQVVWSLYGTVMSCNLVHTFLDYRTAHCKINLINRLWETLYICSDSCKSRGYETLCSIP